MIVRGIALSLLVAAAACVAGDDDRRRPAPDAGARFCTADGWCQGDERVPAERGDPTDAQADE